MPVSTPVTSIFAKNLLAHRSRLVVTPVELSRAAGLHVNTVGRIEKTLCNVRVETVNRLAVAVDVDPCLLLSSTAETASTPSYVLRDLTECVARNVKRLREGLGISQEELSVASELARGYVYKLEAKKISVSLATLDALAAALRVEPWNLVA
jgi:transcriptional regulator with XRE-family HTH domain